MTIDPDTFNQDTAFHGTKALIQVADRVIVLRRDARGFHHPLQIDLPGGGREGHESPFETLHREIIEILNISIEKDDIMYSRRYANNGHQSDDSFFVVTRRLDLDESKIVFGEKGLMYHFMTIHDYLENTESVEKQKERIIDYLNAVKAELT